MHGTPKFGFFGGRARAARAMGQMARGPFGLWAIWPVGQGKSGWPEGQLGDGPWLALAPWPVGPWPEHPLTLNSLAPLLLTFLYASFYFYFL